MRRFLVAVVLLSGCASYSPPPATVQGGPDSLDLIIAGTTDVHGWVRGWDYFANAPDTTRGLSRMATIVDSLRRVNPDRVVLVDAGDLLQGTPITSIALRDSLAENPIIAAMNAMRYDAAAIGNHEFNYGLAYLSRAMAQARFPFLAANAYRSGGRPAYPRFTVVERAGVRVAVIGGTTPGSMIWDRDKLRGSIVIGDIVPGVREAVQAARSQGADVVVAVLHSGLAGPSSYDEATTGVPPENVAARVAQEVPGIDLIVFGHSHRELPDTTIGTTLLTQPRNWAGSLSVATLSLTRSGGRWRVAARRAHVVRGTGHAEHPEVVAAVADAHQRTIAFVTAPIGTTPVAWRSDSARVMDTPIVDFVLEVTRRHANADLSSVAAFNLNADFGPGPITIADMAELYPYENNILRAIRISGRQLRDYLEFSARYFRASPPPDSLIDPSIPGFNYDIVAGVDYALDITKPIGSRVVALTRNGRPVADADSFTLALHDYRQQGGGGYTMIQGAPVVYDQQEQIRELLIAEVRRRGVIRPEDYFRRNWRLLPDSLIGPAYRSMRQLPYDRPRTTPTRTTGPVSGPRLRVISTNDLHGHMQPWSDRDGSRKGGIAKLATAIARARAECQPPACVSLVLDGGDMMQGPAMSSVAYGRPMIEAMNAIGYDAAAVGNHEFDWGEDTLRARMRQARFPILGANVRERDGRDVSWIPNDTIFEVGGRRIGVIGLGDPHTATRTRATGLSFLAPARVVDSTARVLRQRGAEAVVVVAHIGGRCDADAQSNCRGDIIDLARETAASVDAFISGDSHTLINTEIGGTPVVQAGRHGGAITVTDIPLGSPGLPARGELRVIGSDTIPDDPAVATIVRRAAEAVEARTSVVVTTSRDSLLRRGREYPLGRLIADAQRAAGNADFALVNNGGIRRDLPPGRVTYGMLFELQPFGNYLHRVTATGAAIRAYLDHVFAEAATAAHLSGLVVRYDSTRPPGRRIVDLRRTNGRPFSDSARYTLVLNEFMLLGGDRFGFQQDVIRSERLRVTDLEALIAYLRRQPRPLVAPAQRRLIFVGAE